MLKEKASRKRMSRHSPSEAFHEYVCSLDPLLPSLGPHEEGKEEAADHMARPKQKQVRTRRSEMLRWTWRRRRARWGNPL